MENKVLALVEGREIKESDLKLLVKNLTRRTRPKNPKITEGIPAIMSIKERIILELFLLVLKLKNNPQPTLKGVAIKIAKNET
jgi:hypothetical protein